ncbi:hypothetical protein C0995_008294 [Termitomyces sp. Mi166|nr:hypothetical protein C0995_008294 [Termitomyces sp. Mi166\
MSGNSTITPIPQNHAELLLADRACFYGIFLAILAYATVGIIFKFSEESYVEHRDPDMEPFKFYEQQASNYVDVFGEVRFELSSFHRE